MKVVGDKTILRVSNLGLAKSIKFFDMFSIEEEHAMLSQVVYQPTSLWS